MNKQFFYSVLFLLCSITTGAQELTVKSFGVAQGDLSANVNPRSDRNGVACGLVKVQLAVEGAKFNGSVVGDVTYSLSEYWVYMNDGAYLLEVSCPGFLPLSINLHDHGLKDGVQPKTTYKLVLVKTQAPLSIDVNEGNYVVLSIQPANSVVLIGDSRKSVGSDGTVKFYLLNGSHDYSVSAPGYATARGTLKMNGQRIEKTIMLESEMASVRVTCGTSDAEIYVDDQLKGTSPWSGLLESGTYRIEARKSGFLSQAQSVRLSKREQRTVKLPQLMAQMGRLNIDYTPTNAEVYLDGKLLGRTPDIFRDIAIGSHEVEVRASGYSSKKEKVFVSEGQTISISGNLEKEEQMTESQMNDLGDDYFHGRNGKPQDYIEAVKWYHKSAEQGNADAQNNLGTMYKEGRGVAQDYAEAVKWYRKAAEQGNAAGQCSLGISYILGEGVAEDEAEADKWFRVSAEQGYADAQFHIGLMYHNLRTQHDKIHNYSEALKWFLKAAEQEHPVAYFMIGYTYDYGCGVPINKCEAFKWYRKAAERGNLLSQLIIAYKYEIGDSVNYCVKKNLTEAAKWYRKAADQGDFSAMYKLGEMYEKGDGVNLDKAEAVVWYRKAADQVDNDNPLEPELLDDKIISLMYKLGEMYEKGDGVNLDKAEAQKWYDNAASIESKKVLYE